ncbi:hypothetical protein ACR2R6_06135 [Methylocaldum gracile subsp. desertum]|uniref:hypothetical protein n=1 Tax=Methylocaldum sp. GT1BW TaxID=3438964 RepID=UPI003DA08539
MNELLMFFLGFFFGLVPSWFQRKRRLKTHWCALRAEIEQCREKAETLLRDNVESPLYRLPVMAYQISFPILLADGGVEENEVSVIGRFFSQTQDINRGLDNAAEMLKSGNDGQRKQEHDRNCLKVKGLINAKDGKESLYIQAKKIVDGKIALRFWHYSRTA